MKELLFLSHRIPYPPNKGDKIRSYHMLQFLARRYRVHLGTFIDDPTDRQHVPALQQLCAETCVVDLHPRWAQLRSLPAFAGADPLSLRYYRDLRLQRWVSRLLGSGSVQRVVVFSSPMAQYVETVPAGVRRVLDFVDVDSEKWREYSLRRPWPWSWVYRREARTLLDYERRQARQFDSSLFVSAPEAALFVKRAPEVAARVSYFNNGVDSDFFDPDREYANPFAPDEQALVFTGAMDYWANVDAVRWFAQEVLPLIRQTCPLARFYIVGTRPTREVMALASLAGVCVTGAVADVRPYLAHAKLVVAPLRIARGLQNKVLEAMAMARPIVATPQALEGIEPDIELWQWAAAEAREMAHLAQRLLGDGAARQLGQRHREQVLRRYHWGRGLERLAQALEGEASATTIEVPSAANA